MGRRLRKQGLSRATGRQPSAPLDTYAEPPLRRRQGWTDRDFCAGLLWTRGYRRRGRRRGGRSHRVWRWRGELTPAGQKSSP